MRKSTYQVRTYKVSQSMNRKFVFFLLSKRRIRKTLNSCQRKTTAINVFILNIFSVFLLYNYVWISKAYLNRSFEAVQFPASRLHFLETRRFCPVSSACRMSLLYGIQTGCKSCIRAIWRFFLLDRKWSFYETKLNKNIEVWHSFGKWLLLHKWKFYVSVLLLIIKSANQRAKKIPLL